MTDQQQASWSVVAQQQQTKVGPTGVLDDGFNVLFTTGNGHTGSVFVPMSQYNVDNVRALVQAQANLLDAVGALSN